MQVQEHISMSSDIPSIPQCSFHMLADPTKVPAAAGSTWQMSTEWLCIVLAPFVLPPPSSAQTACHRRLLCTTNYGQPSASAKQLFIYFIFFFILHCKLHSPKIDLEGEKKKKKSENSSIYDQKAAI